MKELIIEEKYAGGRLDKIIFKYLDKASSGFVYKMLRKKNITLNDRKASGSEIVNAGDSIKLYLSDETIAKFKSGLSVRKAAENDERRHRNGKMIESFGKHAVNVSLKTMIVFEDDNIIAVNKPAGMLSQKAAPEDISINEMIADYIKHDDLFTPGISNRLDRNTSGLIIAGKNPAASRELNRAVAERDISKYYICLVSGMMNINSVEEAYLVKDEAANTARISNEPSEDSQHIVPGYRTVCHGFDSTLLSVELITGRSHQIRANLAALGAPIIGDTKYNTGSGASCSMPGRCALRKCREYWNI